MAQAQTTAGRSKGKNPGGRIRIGQIVNPTQTQRASIPSKFETILNTGVREKDGFARRTHRFDEPENDLPGPGYYHAGKNLVKDAKGDYTSKRGTAGFASAQKRFYEEPRPLFVVPGPGKYEGAAPIMQGYGAAAASSKGTSSFVAPVPRRAIPSADAPVPGPGHYDIVDAPVIPDPKASAVFTSKASRTDLSKGPQVPGPGAYGDSTTRYRSCAEKASKLANRAGFIPDPLTPDHPRPAPPVSDPVFRSMTNREGRRLHKEEILDPNNLPPVPGNPAPTKKQREATAAKKQAGEIAPPSPEGRPSSMFAPTTLDRFGRATVKFSLKDDTTPGPGYYVEPDMHNQKMLISSSWAMSGEPRFKKGRRATKPPGPAYYNPNNSSKTSFHANVRQTFV